jgi:hypothetical protein
MRYGVNVQRFALAIQEIFFTFFVFLELAYKYWFLATCGASPPGGFSNVSVRFTPPRHKKVRIAFTNRRARVGFRP